MQVLDKDLSAVLGDRQAMQHSHSNQFVFDLFGDHDPDLVRRLTERRSPAAAGKARRFGFVVDQLEGHGRFAALLPSGSGPTPKMSGRSSYRVTAPPVTSSIGMQYRGGSGRRSERICQRNCGFIPIARQKADFDGNRFIASWSITRIKAQLDRAVKYRFIPRS